MEKVCEQCGISFKVNEKNKRHRNRRFCGSKCSSSHNGKKNKGRKYSDEVNKTKGLSGPLNPMFGKSHSIELRKQITLSKLKTNLKNVKNCNLSEIEREVLDGIMISDGCLTSTTSISARLSLGFKYFETLEDIKKSLPSIDFGKTNVSKDGKSFHNKSKMYGDLLSENERWYKDKVKIIPDDFRLTQTSCYWWLIGDGYNVDGNVFLCTDSYDKEYNEKIIKRINDLGFKCNLTSRNRIRFYKNSSLKFLKWITPKNGINQQYIYKWKKK